MTVLENVMIGRYPRTRAGLAGALLRTPAQRAEERAIAERAWALLADVGLADHAHEPAGSLPFGQQRLLDIARSLAAEPVLLLLDEPAAGLNVEEAAALGAFIRRIRLFGATTLPVEHHMDLVMEISDEILVLNFGQALAEGTPEAIRTDPRVIQAYLGDEASLPSISGLSCRYGGIAALKGVDLAVREGQLVTIIGPNGAGKSTLLKAIVGAVDREARR